MDAVSRKYNARAAYSYLAGLALYILPTVYFYVKASEFIPNPFPLILVIALVLWVLIAVGVKLKAGKMWAKVLVLPYSVSMVLFFVPMLFHSRFPDLLRVLSFLALNSSTVWFLLKADPQRSAGPEASEHNQANH